MTMPLTSHWQAMLLAAWKVITTATQYYLITEVKES